MQFVVQIFSLFPHSIGLAEHLQGENTAFGVLGSQLLTANFLPIAANGSYNENWVTMCKNSCNRKTL